MKYWKVGRESEKAFLVFLQMSVVYVALHAQAVRLLVSLMEIHHAPDMEAS